MDKVEVSATALRQLLQALLGPAHLIRELMVIRDLAAKGLADPDPITILVNEYNAAAEAYNITERAKEVGDESC